jgi:hypothetical protein
MVIVGQRISLTGFEVVLACRFKKITKPYFHQATSHTSSCSFLFTMAAKDQAIAAVTALGDGISPMAAAAYALGYVAGHEHSADGGWTKVSVDDAVPSG